MLHSLATKLNSNHLCQPLHLWSHCPQVFVQHAMLGAFHPQHNSTFSNQIFMHQSRSSICRCSWQEIISIVKSSAINVSYVQYMTRPICITSLLWEWMSAAGDLMTQCYHHSYQFPVGGFSADNVWILQCSRSQLNNYHMTSQDTFDPWSCHQHGI